MTRSRSSSQSRSRRSAPPGRQRTRLSWWGLGWRLSVVGLVVLVGWVVYLDVQVTSQFEEHRWEVPSRVYARALELYEGQTVRPDHFEEELALLDYDSDSGLSRAGTYDRQGSRFRVRTRGFDFPETDEPARTMDVQIQGDVIQSLTLAGGNTLPIARLEPLRIGGIYPAHNEDRELIRLQQVPDTLRQALLVVEDRNFLNHRGVEPSAIVRAAVANFRAGRVVQGGSTLTQQLVKNFYLTADRTYTRKINEALMSLLLEWRYDKADILEAYINEVYLGQAGQRAIHGFGLGSQFYFGKSVEELDVHESALLVALIRGPTYYNPRRHPERAMERRNLVLRLMVEADWLSEEQGREAADRPLGVVSTPRFRTNAYPAFMDLVREHLQRDYDDEDLSSAGLNIFTTLDPIAQRTAIRQIRETLDGLPAGPDLDSLNAAMILTRPQSGEVEALVGGRDAGAAGFNRAMAAFRPIGSLVKPMVYLAALENPEQYTLISPVKDEPFRIVFNNGDEWSPRNFDGESLGEIPLHRALAESRNQATVRLGLDVGIESVIDRLERMGLPARPPAYPSLLLGSLDLSPLQVTELYQTLAASGYRVPLRSITAVTDRDGEVLSRYDLEIDQVVDSAAVHLLQYAMIQAMREGTGTNVYHSLPQAMQVAGKTGTTDGGRDTWFAGMTGNRLGVTWVGTDDNRPTLLTGSSAALPVWGRVMAALPNDSLSPVVPGNIRYEWIDNESGAITDENCEDARQIPFIAGSEPSERVSCRDSMGGRIQRWFQQIF